MQVLGITLILQWLPNTTLETNPKCIRTISPNKPSGQAAAGARVKLRHLEDRPRKRNNNRSSSESSSDPPIYDPTDSQSVTTPASENEEETDTGRVFGNAPTISLEMNGDKLKIVSDADNMLRPQTLDTPTKTEGLDIPAINVIPNTPTRPEPQDSKDSMSPPTSGCDEGSEDETTTRRGHRRKDRHHSQDDGHESSPYSSNDEDIPDTPTDEDRALISDLLQNLKAGLDYMETSPEVFALKHNLMLPDGIQTGGTGNPINSGDDSDTGLSSPTNTDIEMQERRRLHHGPCLFSIDLGTMRSLRLFSSNSEGTCGQLVIASPESQYKILHFHHGGLDKLGQIFEQWSVLRARSKSNDSPASPPMPSQQFAICRPAVGRSELHPEEGLYEKVTPDLWRSYTSASGSIEDCCTLMKLIFFGGLDRSLAKEAWPFLLHVYPWNSTSEQREAIRNDLFLEYQNIRKKRLKSALRMSKSKSWTSIDSSIHKDVIRTDRINPFFHGDPNPNLDIMRNILLNYAAFCPSLGYIQGMSDLLAPILSIIQNEADAFWCFAGLMQRTIFVCTPMDVAKNSMECNLDFLRGLLKTMYPQFYRYMLSIVLTNHYTHQADSPIPDNSLQLLFTHRWILLCFKREFPDPWALRIWESCWSCSQTPYFHLFVCLAIIMSYGGDVMQQKLMHDEVLLYFSSLAMHMDAAVILQKARGLLCRFLRLESVPCYLSGIWDQAGPPGQRDTWDGGHVPHIDCVHAKLGEPCCVIDRVDV